MVRNASTPVYPESVRRLNRRWRVVVIGSGGHETVVSSWSSEFPAEEAAREAARLNAGWPVELRVLTRRIVAGAARSWNKREIVYKPVRRFRVPVG